MTQSIDELLFELKYWKQQAKMFEHELNQAQKDNYKLAQELANSLNSGLLPNEVDDGK